MKKKNLLCTNLIIFIIALNLECIALYSYAGVAGDLSFTEGDIIKVHKDEGDWWEGSCNGQEGLFPANYVKKKDTEVHVFKS